MTANDLIHFQKYLKKTANVLIHFQKYLKKVAEKWGCKSWMEARVITYLATHEVGRADVDTICKTMGFNAGTPMHVACQKTIYGAASRGALERIGENNYQLSRQGLAIYAQINLYLSQINLPH